MFEAHQRREHQPTIFGCRAPMARSVFLAGSFNHWDPTKLPMRRHPDGTWGLALQLNPGRYEFKFIIDGQWCCDPEKGDAQGVQAGCVPNPFGTMNCVVDVK